MRRYSGLWGGDSRGYTDASLLEGVLLPCKFVRRGSREVAEETRENITRPRQSRRRIDWTIDMRFWKTTSSARIFSLELMANISLRDSSRWDSSDMTVLCQISSYCCLNTRSSSKTVEFSVSRNAVVFCSCFFSTFVNASRRILDCSSMYLRERVEFVSRSCNRLETALKKDS